MKMFLEVNLVMAAILVTYYFYVMRKKVFKTRQKLRFLFFHEEIILEFKKITENESNLQEKSKFETQLRIFKASLIYLIVAVIMLIVAIAANELGK